MTSTQQTPDQLPTPLEPRPRRRRRTALIAAGTGVLLVGGVTVGAVVLGVDVATSLRHDTTTQSVPDVRELVLDLDEGSVRLTAGAGPDVEVRTTLAWTPGYEPVLDQRLVDGVLTLRSDCADFNVGCEVTREIGVPAGTAVRIHSVAGPVDATDLDVPRFDVETTAGPVTASFATAPDVIRVDTVAGPVTLRVPQGAYRVDADTVIGPVRVDVDVDPAATSSIEAQTVTGPVTVEAR
jgi:hypothetical protein